ncbi:MAG: DUF167 domain-containing protein [SAR324 cluster bacterium]|nr:DUF167 domain-containing protein [SAR324 cluster bacterium]
MTECFAETEKGLVLQILAQPKSSNISWGKVVGGRIQLRLNCPPVEGKANAVAQKWLSKVFKCPKTEVRLLRGEKAKEKTFLLTSYDQGKFLAWKQENLL